MLVITRKIEQGLHIGDEIEIKVLDIFSLDSGRGGRAASIGINAPLDMKILRKELYDTQRENRAAVETVGNISGAQLGRMLKSRRGGL